MPCRELKQGLAVGSRVLDIIWCKLLPFMNFIAFVLNKTDAKEKDYKEKWKIQPPALKDFRDIYIP
jgi:hypothetical protein